MLLHILAALLLMPAVVRAPPASVVITSPSNGTSVYAGESFYVTVVYNTGYLSVLLTLECPYGPNEEIYSFPSGTPFEFPTNSQQQGNCTLSAVADFAAPSYVSITVLSSLILVSGAPSPNAVAGVPFPVLALQSIGGPELINVTLSCPAFDNVTQSVLSNTDVTVTPPNDYYGDCTYSILYPPEGYYSTSVVNVVMQSPLVVVSPAAGANLLAGQTYPVLVNASNEQTGIDAAINFVCTIGDPFTQTILTGIESTVLIPQDAGGTCDVIAFSSNATYANSTTIQVTTNTVLSLVLTSTTLNSGQDSSVLVNSTNSTVITIPLVLTCPLQSYSQDVDTGSAQPYSIPVALSGVACVFTTPDVPEGYTPITPVTVNVVLGAQGIAAILQQFNFVSFSDWAVQFSSPVLGSDPGVPLKAAVSRVPRRK